MIGPILLGAWVTLMFVLAARQWAWPRREHGRIDGWWHGLPGRSLNGNALKYSDQAWRDACRHSTEKSRVRRALR